MKKFFIMAAACFVLLSCNNKKEEEKKSDVNTVTGTEKKPAMELLDPSTATPVIKMHEAWANRDLDGMVADLADNVKYTWSSGDSVMGKQGVKDYYAGRLKLIKEYKILNKIVLPVQANESLAATVPGGKWILYWQEASVTYNNGKMIHFWIHNTNHLDDAGKIDFVGQYIDKAPIIEATKDLMGK
jgi:hypothetical protein